MDGTIEAIELNEVLVGAAMIRFCIDSHVPLPLHATKSLKVASGQLVLDITVPREPATLATALDPLAAAS